MGRRQARAADPVLRRRQPPAGAARTDGPNQGGHLQLPEGLLPGGSRRVPGRVRPPRRGRGQHQLLVAILEIYKRLDRYVVDFLTRWQEVQSVHKGDHGGLGAEPRLRQAPELLHRQDAAHCAGAVEEEHRWVTPSLQLQKKKK